MYQVGDQVVYSMHGVCCVLPEEKKVIERKTVTYSLPFVNIFFKKY